MRKLSGMDASFLYSETPNTPQHVGNIQYVEVPRHKRATYFEDLKALYSERAHLVPYLTQKLKTMPWGIDHPVWIRDREFDIDAHFNRVTLEAPGSMRQLEELTAELYEPMLDRDKPLWQVWVIEGLADNQVAVFSKIHHACIDGMASVAAVETLSDDQPSPRAVEPASAEFWNEPEPPLAELMRESFVNLTKYSVDAWSRWPSQVATGIRAARESMRSSAERPTSAKKAPWNAPIDGRRALAGTAFSLSTLKLMSKETRTKINDVILAIMADALERYFARQGVSHEGPMIAVARCHSVNLVTPR